MMKNKAWSVSEKALLLHRQLICSWMPWYYRR